MVGSGQAAEREEGWEVGQKEHIVITGPERELS